MQRSSLPFPRSLTGSGSGSGAGSGAGDRPRLAAVGLLASNLVPLVGVLAFGWTLHSLLIVYWLESGIVGASYVAKILRAEGADDPADLPSMSFNDTPVSAFVDRTRPAIARFFVGHYGVFWAVHGLFVFLFGGFVPGGLAPAEPVAVATAAVGLVASHAYSYRANYVGEREYERVGPVTLMVEPYRRVIVLHLTIVLGAFAVGAIGSPIGALLVMIVLKTGIDLRAHLREHERARARPVPDGIDGADETDEVDDLGGPAGLDGVDEPDATPDDATPGDEGAVAVESGTETGTGSR